jgi:predicted RNA-binding protein YlqC (UPF0109 family)
VSDALASLDDPGEAGLESVADESSSRSTDVPTAVRVLTYLVKALVAHPDDVRVEIIEARPLQLGVRVAAGDLGRVIGKRGRNADAIRTLVRAAAALDGAEIDVEFLD